MPVTLQFNATTLRPNYPEDRNAAGYFSHVKSWSLRDGAIYIPPTNGEFGRFFRRLGREFTFSAEDNFLHVKECLSQVNLWQMLGIDSRTFFARFTGDSSHSYGHRTNSAGTDAVQIVQTALNMYALCKQRYGRAWKVDFIHVARNEMNNRQDDGFRGRCIFRLNNATISLLIDRLSSDIRSFWVEIFSLYDGLAVHNYRISNPDYADRPTITRQRRTPSAVREGPPTSYNSVWNTPPAPVRRDPTPPREPAPNTRLAQEYLSRTVVDDSIPAEQLAEMLRRVGNALSGEVRDMIYDMLTTDFNGSAR